MTLQTNRPFVPSQKAIISQSLDPDTFTAAYMDDLAEFMDTSEMELQATNHVGCTYKISAYSDE